MAKRTRTANSVETSHNSGKNGGKLRRGNPGNKGGGRRPQKFSTFLKGLRENPDVHTAIEKAATDSTSRGFAPVLKTMADYDEEKPSDKTQLSGELVIRVVRDVATEPPAQAAPIAVAARIAKARDAE